MKATLQRRYELLQTIGIFKMWNDDGEKVFESYSMELPWKNNKSFISCIPEGSYKCEITSSPIYGFVFEVTGVESRSHVLIHPLNYVIQSEACIGLGKKLVDLNNDNLNDITSSKKTVQELQSLCKEFTLTIQ